MTLPLPLPGVQHGHRIVISIIDQIAAETPQAAWVSVPVSESDLSKGWKDISYAQLNNAVGHAVSWLKANLPASADDFQPFAYLGPKDLRYAAFAVAAAKLGKVIVLPSGIIPAEARMHVLNKTSCSIFVSAASTKPAADELLKLSPSLTVLVAPEYEEIFSDTPVATFKYDRTWDQSKDDPWIVFHTSGTTSLPKPVRYTHRMMAIPDYAASLKNISETHIHQYAKRRWYIPMPMLHFVGMLMVLSMTSSVGTVPVLGPSNLPPTPDVVKAVLQHGQVDGALLLPVLIDVLCRDPASLAALRSLKNIHYVGAPLPLETGLKLSSHVAIASSIGSTEAGGYFTVIANPAAAENDWDYIEFQPSAGAIFEPRGDLHELVFTKLADSSMQQIFMMLPETDRYETSDLWVQHPKHQNCWKIVGRVDDYVYLAQGSGLHARLMETEIEKHELVQAALIGGHGKPQPVLIVELAPGAEKQAVLSGIQPYIDRINEKHHQSVHLSKNALIFAVPEKPFIRTLKGNVARSPSLKLYAAEIEGLFKT